METVDIVFAIGTYLFGALALLILKSWRTIQKAHRTCKLPQDVLEKFTKLGVKIQWSSPLPILLAPLAAIWLTRSRFFDESYVVYSAFAFQVLLFALFAGILVSFVGLSKLAKMFIGAGGLGLVAMALWSFGTQENLVQETHFIISSVPVGILMSFLIAYIAIERKFVFELAQPEVAGHNVLSESGHLQ